MRVESAKLFASKQRPYIGTITKMQPVRGSEPILVHPNNSKQADNLVVCHETCSTAHYKVATSVN